MCRPFTRVTISPSTRRGKGAVHDTVTYLADNTRGAAGNVGGGGDRDTYIQPRSILLLSTNVVRDRVLRCEYICFCRMHRMSLSLSLSSVSFAREHGWIMASDGSTKGGKGLFVDGYLRAVTPRPRRPYYYKHKPVRYACRFSIHTYTCHVYMHMPFVNVHI